MAVQFFQKIVSFHPNERFDKLVVAWEKEQKPLRVAAYGTPDIVTHTEAYQAIIARAETFLPEVIERVSSGDYRYNRVLMEILGLKVSDLLLDNYPNEHELSVQLLSIASKRGHHL